MNKKNLAPNTSEMIENLEGSREEIFDAFFGMNNGAIMKKLCPQKIEVINRLQVPKQVSI